MSMRVIATIGLSLLGVFASRCVACAQAPGFSAQRLTTIVVPAVAGGATDIIARIISKNLSQSLDQNVIVDNRGGANGNIGSAMVARAAPDGHTLLLAPNSNLVINQFTTLNMGYDPLVDLTPVAFVAEAPELVASSAKFPATTMKEFVDAVRAKPGVYSYGSPGIGSPPHLSTERLLRVTGMKMTHVPYRGAAAAMTDVAGGSIQMAMAALASIEPFSQSGTARVLAVAGTRRLKSLPDAPTLAETGWNEMEMSVWWGVMAPKGTPPETVRLLNAKLREAFSAPETVDALEKIGIVAHAESTESFDGFMHSELKRWEAVVKDIGLQPQ